MSSEDKKSYDLILQSQNKFEGILRELHFKLFSEEFDEIGDSNTDANRRRQGENPMCKEHIQKIDQKRLRYGVQPLSENGCPKNPNESLDFCKKLITKEIEFLK